MMTRVIAFVAALSVGTATLAQQSDFDFGGAEPLAPEKWFSPHDFPSAPNSARITGRVQVAFDINAEGRVEECVVTKSSGNLDLDQTSCRLLTRRGRFNPLKTAQGDPIATKGRLRVLWKLKGWRLPSRI